MPIFNREALQARANGLNAFNGIQLVLVRLAPPAAILEVHFFNSVDLPEIVAAVTAHPEKARDIFSISGGRRVVAGSAVGQVQVTAIAATADPQVLELTVQPIGDYSVYTLAVYFIDPVQDISLMDPLFSEISLKFRPGCFSADCSPDWPKPPKPFDEPLIDYLNKDYESIRHTLMAAMGDRVPGWRPTSEADLDQVILELFSAASDELSDYQDRVMAEAYLGTARKRVTLARHARLMDYHIHQGNQASTWIALELPVANNLELKAGLRVMTGGVEQNAQAVVFIAKASQVVDTRLNRLSLYTWSGAIPSLAAGATTADVKLNVAGMLQATEVQDLMRSGSVSRLLVQEWMNPATGRPIDADSRKRQILRLLPGKNGATAMFDPVTGEAFIRVVWQDEDKLRFPYCFAVDCATVIVSDVSLFHGNLLQVYHGALRSFVFREPGQTLGVNEYHFERPEQWGAFCRLPEEPLAYVETAPGGEEIPRSTLEVTVAAPAEDVWGEKISLIHSDNSTPGGRAFVVETDENLRSIVRFGNGENGLALPDQAVVTCSYQAGFGPDGNIGADTLAFLDPSTLIDGATDTLVPGQAACWNPFAATNGRAPEPPAQIIRRAPEAYRFRQLRAVTLKDYVKRAEELPEVSRAAASYAWTGSWRTVRIAIDPRGATTISDSLRLKLMRHLDAVRLIGEDIEIRSPLFVPLEIHVALCAGSDYWPEDLRFLLEQEFSTGFTADGRLAFFNPDLWTFGQAIHASQILGRVQAIEGVEHVISLNMKRWTEPGTGSAELLNVRPNEIVLVNSDPDRMEEGYIAFDIQGGRR